MPATAPARLPARRILFAGLDPMSGAEPWVSDGTAAGTVMVKDMDKSGEIGSRCYITTMGGKLYFRARRRTDRSGPRGGGAAVPGAGRGRGAVGRRSPDRVEITSGISRGDRVSLVAPADAS